MSRDDEFTQTARAYLEAFQERERAKRELQAAQTRVETLGTELERRKAVLAKFVGANVRTRNAVVKGMLVRVQFGEQNSVVYVEDVSLDR